MAKETAKTPTLQQRIAARQAKRAEVGKEAQVRVAAAWTIAKTMLPTAPNDIRKKFASVLLGASTKALKAALRQTAVNAHYTKIADTLREVHKVELNQLLEASGDLEKAKSEVKAELKGDAKAATSKKADDRKDAGPQPASYNEGDRTEPKGMDADNAGKREALTVDKTEGGEKIQDAVQDSARAKEATVKKAEIMGGTGAAPAAAAPASKPAASPAPSSGAPSAAPAAKAAPSAGAVAPSPVAGSKAEIRASAKKACEDGCKGCDKCKKESSSDGKPNSGEVLQTKSQTAAKAKKADEMPMGDGAAIPGGADEAMPAPAEAPMGEEPMGDEPAAAEELQQDDTQAVLKEKIEEAQQAVQAIEQEVDKEESEEIDLSGMADGQGPADMMGEAPVEEPMDMQDIFSDSNLEEKASNLANEGHEAADDDFFGPSASSELEASLDDSQFASMDDMFTTTASADPMSALFGGKSAANVEGFEVVPSSTGEAANKMKAEHGSDDRDNTTDHDEDILSLLVEGLNEQGDGQERVKQDATPELEAPAAKSAAKTATLKKIKATAAAPAATQNVNIADALFASIDSVEDDRNSRTSRR